MVPEGNFVPDCGNSIAASIELLQFNAKGVSELLNLTAFLGTVDMEVHTIII